MKEKKCKLCNVTHTDKGSFEGDLCLDCHAIYKAYCKHFDDEEQEIDKTVIKRWLIYKYCNNCEEYEFDDDWEHKMCLLDERPIVCQLIRGMV